VLLISSDTEIYVALFFGVLEKIDAVISFCLSQAMRKDNLCVGCCGYDFLIKVTLF
jgi:hypothetical protein